MSDASADGGDSDAGSNAALDAEARSAIEELKDARAAQSTVRDRIDEVGREALSAIISARDDMRSLLSKYRDRAVGTESFGAFVQFRAELQQLVDGLPADLPERSTFEDIAERFEKSRLHASDFEWATEQLDRLDRFEALLEEERAAADRVSRARRAVREERDRLADRLDRLAELRTFEDLDLDAPVDSLRDPIDRYNELVQRDYRTFRREVPASEFAEFLRTAERYPLVSARSLPEDVGEYIDSTPAGENTIEELLEYSTFSPSKLHHYVDDPTALKRSIATQRTAIDRHDVSPFLIEWPPPRAAILRWRLRELRPVVDRFAGEETIVALREVRSLLQDTARYRRLRQVAVANEELSASERDLLESGNLEAETRRVRASLDRLDEALADDTE